MGYIPPPLPRIPYGLAAENVKNIVSIGRFMKEKNLKEFPVCNVCGGQIAEAAVLCPKCGVPHHLDCWEYQGGKCSVYGCMPVKKVIVDDSKAGSSEYTLVSEEYDFANELLWFWSGLFFFILSPFIGVVFCIFKYYYNHEPLSIEKFSEQDPSQLEGPETKD